MGTYDDWKTTPPEDKWWNLESPADDDCEQCEGVGLVPGPDELWGDCPRCKGTGIEPERKRA